MIDKMILVSEEGKQEIDMTNIFCVLFKASDGGYFKVKFGGGGLEVRTGKSMHILPIHGSAIIIQDKAYEY